MSIFTHKICSIPNLECSMSDLECSNPNLECSISNMECSVPDLECRMSNLECPESNKKCSVANMECPESNRKCPISYMECSVANRKCSVSYLECSVPDRENHRSSLIFNHGWTPICHLLSANSERPTPILISQIDFDAARFPAHTRRMAKYCVNNRD